MSRAVKLRNDIEYKTMLLEGNPQFENFYKEELVDFCKVAKKIILEQQQENQQLKEQLKSKEQELKGFTNAIAEYLGFDEPEHTTYDEIFDKINQFKLKVQQREEVIEECKRSIDNFMTHIDDGFCADMMTFIDILNKHTKEESE